MSTDTMPKPGESGKLFTVHDTGFTPWGTLAFHHRLEQQPSKVSEWERFTQALRPGCNWHNLEDSHLALAISLAEKSQLDGRQQQAFLLLLLCGLIAVERGSSFLPLMASDEEERIRSLLADLLSPNGAEPPEGWTVGEALQEMQAIVEAKRTPLLGNPASYRPLILEGERIYHQRLHSLEARLRRHLQRLADLSLFAIDEAQLDRDMREIRQSQPIVPRADGTQGPLVLEPEQQYAMLAAARFHMTIVSGGPGTGKTTVIVSILRLLMRLNISPAEMLLAAPTGKAANRMYESIQMALAGCDLPQDVSLRKDLGEPRTLHRLLGYSPHTGTFRHHAGNRLPAKVVVIDEASMIDLFLMDRLLEALPDDARLILIGDADQLPSVEAGAVLHDLSPKGENTYLSSLWKLVDLSAHSPNRQAQYTSVRQVDEEMLGRRIAGLRLGASHRSGHETGIPSLAENTHAGRTDAVLAALHQGKTTEPVYERIEWFSLEEISEESERLKNRRKNTKLLLQRMEDWYDKKIAGGNNFIALSQTAYTLGEEGFDSDSADKVQKLLDHLNSARVLCTTRVLNTGTDALNRLLCKHHAVKVGSKSNDPFHPGTPVMMLHNDYQRGIFNGDQGVIVSVKRGENASYRRVVFQREENLVAFSLDSLRSKIAPSFAMTVHKSQGSEYKNIAFVLPQAPMALVTRQIFYTAITRAKQSALIIGSESVIRHAVDHREVRWSGLG